jgi:membrane dipeptidase
MPPGPMQSWRPGPWGRPPLTGEATHPGRQVPSAGSGGLSFAAMPLPAPVADPAPARLAERLRVSPEALALAHDAEIIDLHIDTFIPPRLWGYDPLRRHHKALLGRWWFGHCDLPRMRDGGLTGAMWSITTNPFRSAPARWRIFQRNLAAFQALIARSEGQLALVRDHAEYVAARARGAHCVLLSIQGGNAVEAVPEGIAAIPDRQVVRATVVHLTNSAFGATSSPLGALRSDKGLTPAGATFIRQCNEQRVFVDLAHIHELAFWQAVEVHDASQPLLVTHTGVDGPRPHWRNLTDAQIQAIAATGGTVGIIFSEPFLTRPGGPRDGAMVVEHMEHVIAVVGDDHVSVGSDYDGMIRPPWDLSAGDTYPRLVQHMMNRGWDEVRIRKVLGGNALRCLASLRPGVALPAPSEPPAEA